MTFAEFVAAARGTGLLGVVLRMVCALLCGGLIGLERENKRRAAGFRTHTLICIGASLTTLTGLYLCAEGLSTDPARLGAQVIAGMGFIGAGTIIITSRRQIKGLTTAAGLWTSAIIGLAIGAGYYEAALIGVTLVLFSELALSKLEYRIISSAKRMNIYAEFTSPQVLNTIVEDMASKNITITDIEFTRSVSGGQNYCAVFSVRFRRRQSHDNIMQQISEIDGVVTVEEL